MVSYAGWTPLHVAAFEGNLAAVERLLAEGADVNAREPGDDTTPLHWAAAAGRVEVVRGLLAAGADPIGDGDDHALQVIGWASCWEGCNDTAHREIVDLLLAHGARHHAFSAVALGLESVLREIAREDPAQLERPLSRNENGQRPLHFAVRQRLAPMVALLVELGADPRGTDSWGYTASAYATSTDIDRPVMERLREMGALDVVGALSLGDEREAGRLLATSDAPFAPGGPAYGALHLLSKRGDLAAVNWLLARGADPDARWPHWDSEVTPLHLAVLGGHAPVVRVLLDAGGDPSLRDSLHDATPRGWAEHAGRDDLAAMLG